MGAGRGALPNPIAALVPSFKVNDMKYRYLLLYATLCAAGLGSHSALAQVVVGDSPYRLTIEGFANATAGHQTRKNDRIAGAREDARIDAGLRFLGQVNTRAGGIFGVRVEGNASPDEHFVAGERSLLYSDSWGRVEIGRRRALPDTLAGYARNNYTFTAAEFGVTSGRTLDPGGTLATAFLPPQIAARIDAISGVGFTSALFFDISPKLIYVSPKAAGFQAGVSYTRDVDDDQGPFKRLLQGGLTHETYESQNVFRIGGSVSHAGVDNGALPGASPGSLNSLSVGASASLDSSLDIGLNFSQNNSSANAPVGPSSPYGARGYTVSVNYNTGPWTFGTYYQQARAGEGAAGAGRDRLNVAQAGASYRISTKVRFYGAYYDYRLHHEGGLLNGTPLTGGVLLLGTRIQL